jgi:hypothetical protein
MERNVTVANPKYGIFVWRSDGRYEMKDAVKLYANQASAEKFASKNVHKWYVVRTLSLIVR